MPDTLFDHGFSANYPKVTMEAKRMLFQSIKEMPWGKWAGYTTPDGAALQAQEQPQPTDSIVSIHNELKKKGGDLLEVPLHRNLTQRGRIGNQQMKDFEERRKVNFSVVPIELYRAADLPMDGSMAIQTQKQVVDMIKTSRPALQRHYVRFLNWLICSYSMYYAFSWNVVNSDRWTNDTKVTPYSHPHIYLSGKGKVSYGVANYPGTSGYETTLGTDLGTLGASDIFDSNFLKGCKADPDIMKIPPVLTSHGNELRFILAHPFQIAALEADPSFKEVTNAAYVQTMLKESPQLYGMKYVIHGFGIFPSDTGIWPVRVADATTTFSAHGWSDNDVVFGPVDANDFTDITTFERYGASAIAGAPNKFAALLLGAGALSIANGAGLEFRRRTDDYGEIKGLAYRVMQGASRGDFNNRDDGTAGEFMVNEGSALLITRASAPSF